MKLIPNTCLALLPLLHAQGQTFSSGSTGADLAFRATAIVLGFRVPPGSIVTGDCTQKCTISVPLREPPNHVYNFTTVDIDSTVTVKFIPNRANTPVYI